MTAAAHTDEDDSGYRVSRPHTWACRHCDMVTDYHLTRDAQVQQAEGVFRHDEDYRAITFKDWLRHFEWDTDPRRDDPAADHLHDNAADQWGAGWSEAWDRERVTVPAPRAPADGAHIGAGHVVERDPVQPAEDVEARRAQLARWHDDDTHTEHAADHSDETDLSCHR